MKTEKTSRGIAVISLIANLFIPGLGTMILSKYDIGTVQIILALIGAFLLPAGTGATIIGMPLFLAMWIWALITGIKALKEIKK